MSNASDKRNPVSRGVKFLQIPPMLTSSETDKVRSRWDTFGQVRLMLEEMGVNDGNRPAPIQEGELADISGSEYSVLYVRWLGWATFVRQRYTEVRALLLQLSNESRDIEANLRRGLVESKVKMTVQEKSDHIWLHPEYNRLQVEIQQQTQLKDMLYTEMDAAEATLKVVSRQVEIRKSEFAGQVREGNLGNTRGYE